MIPDTIPGRALTESFCKQLKLVYSISEEVPEDYKTLCEAFPKFLEHASEEGPLCIVIDSLDQLTDEDGARRFLEWLPRKLPAHVHMITSTLPEEGGCMQRLKAFGIPAGQFLQVNEIGKSVVKTVAKSKTLYFQVNYSKNLWLRT